ELAAVLLGVAVRAGVHVFPHGLRRSHGVGPVRRDHGADRDPAADVAALGALRGRPVIADVAQPARRIPAARHRPAAVRRRRFLMAVANHAVLLGVSALFAFPVIYMFFTAVQSNDQALTGSLWPNPFVWSNFRTVFHEVNVWRYLWNTFLYAGLSTVGVVVSCVPVAYAFSRIDWRGRHGVFLPGVSPPVLPTPGASIPPYHLWGEHFHDWARLSF